MTTPNVTTTDTTDVVVDTARVAGVLWLLGTAVFALLAIYFIGLDQGMTSVFGNNVQIHEFVHDGRHFLGFPCH